jgi:hypothetical protein
MDYHSEGPYANDEEEDKKKNFQKEVGQVTQHEPISFNRDSWRNFGVYLPCGCELATNESITHKCSEQAQNVSRCRVTVDIGKAAG